MVDGVVLVVIVCLVVAGLLFVEFVINSMIPVVALVVDVVISEVNSIVYDVIRGVVFVVFNEVNDMIFVVVLIDCVVCLVVCVIVNEVDGVVLIIDCEVDAEVVAVCKLVKCVVIEGVIDDVIVSVVVWTAGPISPGVLSQSLLFFLPVNRWISQLSPRLYLSGKVPMSVLLLVDSCIYEVSFLLPETFLSSLSELASDFCKSDLCSTTSIAAWLIWLTLNLTLM